MDKEQNQDFEPVQQLYTSKTRSDSAASKWQVDTTLIRQYIEEKLKGITREEVEYSWYIITDLKKQENLGKFLAKNDKQALSILARWCDNKDYSLTDYEFQETDDKEYKIEMKRNRDRQLLPDDVCDTILTPIETTFSQVGYLTRYQVEDIRDELWRNISTIRIRLFELYHERDDLNPGNFELIINMIWNMIKQVLKASEGGWTGEGLRNIMQEKLITNTKDNIKGRGGVF